LGENLHEFDKEEKKIESSLRRERTYLLSFIHNKDMKQKKNLTEKI